MNNRKQVGHYFHSYGFIRAYRHTDGGVVQIGSISSSVEDAELRQWHISLCRTLGEKVIEWFGGYWQAQ